MKRSCVIFCCVENYEMLKALYDFKATFAKTLSFRENEHFVLYQSQTKERNWWQVVNSEGQVGYIPSNYVTTIKVHPQFLIDFLDNATECLRANGDKPNVSPNMDKQDLLLRLIEKKHQAELGRRPKKQAPLPPDFGSTTSVKDSPTSFNNVEAEALPSSSSPRKRSLSEQRKQSLTREAQSNNQIQHKDSQRTSSESSQKKEIVKSNSQSSVRQSPNQSPVKSRSSSLTDINSRTAYLLLDQVRHSTQLSHEMSKVAVTVVLSGLQEILPSSMSHYFDAILSQLQVPLNLTKLNIEETYDANRLKIIFTELTSCKEDSQQRSWMLHEDEPTICEYIKELTSILTNADANVSRHVLVQDQYDGVCTLIQYYQMETRWTIRQLLLQSFGVMCSLDHIVLKIMLESILPMELARDMKSNPRNVEKLNYSSLLLTMIFSMGEPMPITHFEQVGTEFISFLLDLIENPPDTDLDDQIPDQFVNLILSYNLQFNASDNVILDALGERTVAKIFTEKVLFLLNREIDPVRIFDHEPAPPDSVLKIFIDLFTSDDTASLFYTNDIKVLIDIILRQLFDISPGEKRRQYLELCRRVLKMASYNDHRHRCDDILKCFTRIFCEETPESQDDQNLVREISNEFPHLFKM
ncbi:PREDICTED: NCK-interacting protein with SH3 domain isoform X2 [Ceratosolen solmsi marchali]|uniref:NCK-interacting protein with SH3 domain isoform X2 n=2 Tax=Ceratosolen solmsi marchali TaxID=326594 RepID=A0AAJ7DXP4_9HYME|nr:PREDICTED: NCK-interacting protein with SH3 domain isoform X2 [Ceratosolen solmsi marchali]